MISSINIPDIYEHNLNFLIGSGASVGIIPTLKLSIKDSSSSEQFTIESLFTLEMHKNLRTLLFNYYYESYIKPAIELDYEKIIDEDKINVIKNYKAFILTIIDIMQFKKENARKCNIYTTNYDGCLENAMDSLFMEGNNRFIINDGTEGFKKLFFHTKNFYRETSEKGIFDRYSSNIPQINLLHLHGSIYWKKEDKSIVVNYTSPRNNIKIDVGCTDIINKLSRVLADENNTERDLSAWFECLDIIYGIDKCQDIFWQEYKLPPIVNPTKRKFHETLFEENYYQLLRYLSFELERPNTIFITFGFSFADEHILGLIQRSLSNPTLKLYVCCFNDIEINKMESYFKSFPNVQLVNTSEPLTFSVFNEKVFTTKP